MPRGGFDQMGGNLQSIGRPAGHVTTPALFAHPLPWRVATHLIEDGARQFFCRVFTQEFGRGSDTNARPARRGQYGFGDDGRCDSFHASNGTYKEHLCKRRLDSDGVRSTIG